MKAKVGIIINDKTFFVNDKVTVSTADSTTEGVICTITETYISLRHSDRDGAFAHIFVGLITDIS